VKRQVMITARRCSYVIYAGVVLAIALMVGVGMAAAGGSETVYIVRKNDTLSRIAATYGLSVTELAEHNRIKRGAVIYVGQRLRIPSKNKPASPALSSSVRNAIAKAKVRPGRWKYIVLHHSGTESGNIKGMDEYHRTRRRMENGLAYHFVIGNGKGMEDGEVGVGRRWTSQINGGHLASESLNEIAIGICLVGNFDQQGPTRKQLATLDALLRALRDRCKLPASAVKTHQQINPVYTRCPGRHFPTGDFAQGSSKRK
jgi:murein DD-endopeptidase MepM/ murein hydrolase activator NlpD